MLPLPDERQRRIFLASEALSYGYGGISRVSEISGVSIPTIRQGIAEIQAGEITENGRIRKVGAGRKRTEDIYPNILESIQKIVDGNTYGDPERVLSWTTRFRLTTDTLGFGHVLPAAGRARDFHPLERALAGRTEKNSGKLLAFPSFQSIINVRTSATRASECVQRQAT